MFIFFSVGKSGQTGPITAIITQQNSVKWQLTLPPTYLCSCLLKATYKYCISFKKVSFTKAPEAMRANMRSMSGHTGCDHHLTRVSRQRKKKKFNSHQSFLVWINIIYRPNLEWAINQERRILTSAIKNFYMEGHTCSFTVLLISVELSVVGLLLQIWRTPPLQNTALWRATYSEDHMETFNTSVILYNLITITMLNWRRNPKWES